METAKDSEEQRACLHGPLIAAHEACGALVEFAYQRDEHVAGEVGHATVARGAEHLNGRHCATVGLNESDKEKAVDVKLKTKQIICRAHGGKRR